MTSRAIGTALSAALVLGAAAGVSAGGKSLRLGDLALDYDATFWQLTASSADEAVLEPRGDLAGKQDPMRFVKRQGDRDSTCRALAREAWSGELYLPPEAVETDLAGRPALRLTVHTHCRNATPVGRIACMEKDGSVYAVTSVNAITDCRADMPVLFPDPAPLDELLGSLRLE